MKYFFQLNYLSWGLARRWWGYRKQSKFAFMCVSLCVYVHIAKGWANASLDHRAAFSQSPRVRKAFVYASHWEVMIWAVLGFPTFSCIGQQDDNPPLLLCNCPSPGGGFAVDLLLWHCKGQITLQQAVSTTTRLMDSALSVGHAPSTHILPEFLLSPTVIESIWMTQILFSFTKPCLSSWR